MRHVSVNTLRVEHGNVTHFVIEFARRAKSSVNDECLWILKGESQYWPVFEASPLAAIIRLRLEIVSSFGAWHAKCIYGASSSLEWDCLLASGGSLLDAREVWPVAFSSTVKSARLRSGHLGRAIGWYVACAACKCPPLLSCKTRENRNAETAMRQSDLV